MSEYDDLKARIEQLEKSLAYTDGIVVGLSTAMIKPEERLLLYDIAIGTGHIDTASGPKMQLTVAYPGLDKSLVLECGPKETSCVVAARAVNAMELPFPAMTWMLMVVDGPEAHLVVNAHEEVGTFFKHGDRAEVTTVGSGV